MVLQDRTFGDDRVAADPGLPNEIVKLPLSFLSRCAMGWPFLLLFVMGQAKTKMA